MFKKRKKRRRKKKSNQRWNNFLKTIFEEEDDDEYYKPKRVSNFWNNNYIEYEINGNRIENLSLEEYLNKAKPYLRDIILDLQEFETCIIQLKIEIIFISSKYAEEECVMHSRSDNIKFTSYNHANEVADELFYSLCTRYQCNSETSMEGS